jgi:hypothetical protein
MILMACNVANSIRCLKRQSICGRGYPSIFVRKLVN